MGYKAQKTEQAGAKHGNGAYWGPKQAAKRTSQKIRRRAARDLLLAEEWFDVDEAAWQQGRKLHASHGVGCLGS
jgi:hypothetical protein